MRKPNEIYQGEPGVFTIFVRDEEGHYRESLDDYAIEAMLYDHFGKVARTWSTGAGDIDIRTVTVDDRTRGCATFKLTGSETAAMQSGEYAVEVAKLLPDGRAIGKEKAAIRILPAQIKRGVEHEN